ncbi:DUF2480 family protein [Fulvivirga ligni]|uniref:DUF2480 family protein n=1 Tax=Fulvivirga ligni TaxID=2904246 RepID=UPI001F19FFF9|nr:DUF2480 family protein [Fulvivirga ligni]UII21971.1 DUF2480 family protein [Fulvivirga ligni]
MERTGDMEIVNRVASSPLITLDLSEFIPDQERVIIDMKEWLFQEMILREKDFRLKVKEHDWSIYENKYVAINCSVDAIIPTWAYMLLVTKLEPLVKDVIYGSVKDLENSICLEAIQGIDAYQYLDKKVVIKGCSDLLCDPEVVYMAVTKKLTPVVSSLMYGEPCSTVPLYKKKK